MFSIKTVTCRKNHICFKCGKVIQSGERAHRVNTRQTGQIYGCIKCGISREDVLDIRDIKYAERYGDLETLESTEEF